MIAISTINGVLRIQAEIPVPNAKALPWDHSRMAKLMELIEQYVEAAEMVDAAQLELSETARDPKGRWRIG